MFYEYATPIERISIQADTTGALGFVRYQDLTHRYVAAPAELLDDICILMASRDPATSFCVKKGKAEVPALDVLKGGHYHRKHVKNREVREYFVLVEWLQTVPLDEAVHEIGLFGSQNTICQPTASKCRHTVDRLR